MMMTLRLGHPRLEEQITKVSIVAVVAVSLFLVLSAAMRQVSIISLIIMEGSTGEYIFYVKK